MRRNHRKPSAFISSPRRCHEAKPARGDLSNGTRSTGPCCCSIVFRGSSNTVGDDNPDGLSRRRVSRLGKPHGSENWTQTIHRAFDNRRWKSLSGTGRWARNSRRKNDVLRISVTILHAAWPHSSTTRCTLHLFVPLKSIDDTPGNLMRWNSPSRRLLAGQLVPYRSARVQCVC